MKKDFFSNFNINIQALMDSMPVQLFITDLDLKVVFANKRCIEMMELAEDEFIGQPCSVINAENCDADLENCCIRRFKENLGSVTEIKSSYGAYQMHVAGVYNNNGDLLGYICTKIDRTDVFLKDKQLKVKDERLRLTKPYYNCGIWEYDTYEKSLKRDTASSDTFRISDVTYNVPESLINANMVHPRSVEDIRMVFSALDDGEPYIESEIALYGTNNDVFWNRISFTNVFDSNGNLIKAIGITQDITRQKEAAVQAFKERRDLIDEISRDSLTGLFNRQHMIEKVDNFLVNRPKDSGGALILVDIDEIRLINECFGHKMADEFLIKMAEQLRMLFRAGDWICRNGSDEFMIFIGSGNENDIVLKAQQICEKGHLIAKEYAHEKIPEKIVGVCAGIAPLGSARVDFEELSRYADKALFAAKSKGKNEFAIYGKFFQ